MKKPLVSVKMLAYNHEKYIGQAIESVLEQKTDFPFELIIGEDCSTDRTREIVFDYQKKNPDIIRVITSEKNVGMRENGRRIREAAKGKYHAFCEGDDYWCDPLKLQRQVEIMEVDPTISLCFHAVILEYVDSKRKKKAFRYYNKSKYCTIRDVIFKEGDFYKIVSTLIRSSILQELPDWYKQSPAGDNALSLQAALKGRIFYLDKVMAVYRIGPAGSWTDRYLHEPQFRKDYLTKKTQAKKSADKQLNFKYHNSFRKRMRINILDLLLSGTLTKDEKKALRDEYCNYLSLFDNCIFLLFDFSHAYWAWTILSRIRNIILFK